jgi:hypothetical protein
VDDKVVFKSPIYQGNNPMESSGFSGINLSILVNRKQSNVVIALVNQRVYVKFKIAQGMPVYTIQRYNKKWYINQRRFTTILK